mmetsp:Transcript_4285/g.11022  ORF Transcript_4285/g.11022 Transcript_4285/m.11022 type:complete len:230 (-) Transcript_4285:17-706(-)
MISVLILCFLSSKSLALLASSSSLTRCSSSILSLSATWSTRNEERSSFLLHLRSISFFRSSRDLNLRSTSSSSCFLYSSLFLLVFSAIAELFRRSRATRSALAVSLTSGVVRPGSLYRAGPPSWSWERAVSCPSPSLWALTASNVPESSAVNRDTPFSSLAAAILSSRGLSPPSRGLPYRSLNPSFPRLSQLLSLMRLGCPFPEGCSLTLFLCLTRTAKPPKPPQTEEW